MEMREQLAEQLETVFAYKGSELYAHFVSLLGTLDRCYDDDFRQVTPDGLRFKQGAASQVRVLRDVLIRAEMGDLPKV